MRQMGHARAPRNQRRRHTSWNLHAHATPQESATQVSALRRTRHSRVFARRRQRRTLVAPELRQTHPAPIHVHAEQRQLELHPAVLEHTAPLHLHRTHERDVTATATYRRRCRSWPKHLRDEEQVLNDQRQSKKKHKKQRTSETHLIVSPIRRALHRTRREQVQICHLQKLAPRRIHTSLHVLKHALTRDGALHLRRKDRRCEPCRRRRWGGRSSVRGVSIPHRRRWRRRRRWRGHPDTHLGHPVHGIPVWDSLDWDRRVVFRGQLRKWASAVVGRRVSLAGVAASRECGCRGCRRWGAGDRSECPCGCAAASDELLNGCTCSAISLVGLIRLFLLYGGGFQRERRSNARQWTCYRSCICVAREHGSSVRGRRGDRATSANMRRASHCSVETTRDGRRRRRGE